MKLLKLGFVSGVEMFDSMSWQFFGLLSVGDSIESCFAGDWIIFPFIGTAFPSLGLGYR